MYHYIYIIFIYTSCFPHVKYSVHAKSCSKFATDALLRENMSSTMWDVLGFIYPSRNRWCNTSYKSKRESYTFIPCFLYLTYTILHDHCTTAGAMCSVLHNFFLTSGSPGCKILLRLHTKRTRLDCIILYICCMRVHICTGT